MRRYLGVGISSRMSDGKDRARGSRSRIPTTVVQPNRGMDKRERGDSVGDSGEIEEGVGGGEEGGGDTGGEDTETGSLKGVSGNRKDKETEGEVDTMDEGEA